MRAMVLCSNISHPLSIELRELLQTTLDPQGPALTSLDQAESTLFCFQPEALVVVLSPNPERALAALARIRAQVSGAILAVGPSTDPKLILKALHAGVTHYLEEDDLARQLEAVLPRLANNDSSPSYRTAVTVSVLGASGGCGTSTVAANLAVVLARESNRCALVDLKPGAGDLAALLDLKPTHTLADLCLNPARVDQAVLDKALMAHSSGVRLLAPPQQYEDIRLVTPQGVQKALGLARKSFPFVVIDQEDCFHEEQVMAMRQADTILLVARLDFTSLRGTRRILDTLAQMSIPLERMQLVINRHGQAKELPVEEVHQLLKIKQIHLIPEDAASVNGANNTGVPVVIKSPSSRVAQALERLGKSLMPGRASASPSSTSQSGMFRWLSSLR
jgi:pilus assembly protein CpaE